ncbi:MAG: hypothetical protein KDB80_18645, partial [Planctomycetes bacterium]|nr:hypothetical protein [Planctomycetota bacterium]
MGLSKKKALVIVQDETAFGVNALAQGSGESDSDYTARLSANSVLAIDPQPEETVNITERRQATGTKGQRPQPVGAGSGGLTFTTDLTGAADPTNSPPGWTRLLKPAGMQVSAATRIPTVHQGGSPTLQRFMQGELIYGLGAVDAQWEDAQWTGSGSAHGDPAPSLPSDTLDVVFYPESGTVNDAEAITGQLYALHSSVSDVIVVRIDDGIDTFPKSGWHVRVDTDGLGDYAYNQLTADLPVAVCVYPDLQTGGANTNLYCHVYQGTFPPLPGSFVALVGQKSGAYGNTVTTPVSVGTLVRPDSEQQITLD